MTNFFQTPASYALIGIGLLCLASCSDKNEDFSVVPVDASDVQVRFTRAGEDNSSDSFENIHLYQFDGETLVKSNTLYNISEPVTLSTINKGSLYTLAGLELPAVVGETTADKFGATVVECNTEAGNAPLFYSSVTPLSKQLFSNGNMEVALVRSVARIDLVNDVDPNIVINEAIVEDAPVAAYVFGRDANPDDRVYSVSRKFDEPFTGTGNGMFTIFESTRPVHVRIRGSYDGIPMDMSAALPTVSRNKIYTLKVVNVGAQVEAQFEVRDWEEGDTVASGADTSYRITIDAENSVIPAGVTVDYEHNIVNVPYTGVSGLKLAFKGDTRIDVSEVDGLTPAFSYTPNDIQTIDDGYISSFNLDIAEQGKGRLAYSTYFHLKNALLTGSYDFVEVRVDQSPYQIETVKIGGHEWMCFNATSSDLDDQIYILDGLDDVDDMYNQRFAECVGKYFQYGRPNPFSPWTGNNPNQFPLPTDAAERANHVPWTTPGYMPLPEGYHVASFAEWADLIPFNTVIPAEYVSNSGENIRATIVTLPEKLNNTPSASVNKKGFAMRYVLFESLDTGNKLHIPIVGVKSNSTAEVPGYNGLNFDNTAIYWVSNDRCVWCGQFKIADGAEQFSAIESKWNYDGFAPVRGIKN